MSILKTSKKILNLLTSSSNNISKVQTNTYHSDNVNIRSTFNSSNNYDRPILYGSSLRSKILDEFVAIDIETTGLNPYNDKILEISAVRFKFGNICDSFTSLVNPKIKIPRNITEINGITDRMVSGKPPINVVLPSFLSFVGNTPVVAHNAN